MSEFKARIVAELDTAKLNQQIKELQGKNINLNVKTDTATNNVGQVDKVIKQTTKSAETFGQKLKNALGIGSAAALAYKGISLIRQAANNAVNSVKELNQSLTNLRIVTNASESEAEQYMNTYNSMAQSLGATTTEVADTATGWLRQGKSIAETNQLIQDSVKLAKIGMINTADATQYLTSALNGYRLEASQASDIVDKLSKLDSAAAITAAGLAEGMSRTANTARDAGVSIDELLAYLAVIGETTQKSMSSVGESLKTVFTRMSNVKLGKIDFTNEDGTTESLSDVETVLNQLDIKLRASNNEFRDFSDILAEVGAKWTNYSGVQQAAIAKSFAGVRQQENFRVLMNNFDKVKKYIDLSANSAGSAEQKFGAYLDGIEAKSKSLQAAFEGLANNTISSDVVNNIQEATTALVTFIDKSNLIDGAITGLLAGGAVKLFTMLKSGISSATINLNEFNAALQIAKTGNIGTTEVEQLAQVTNNLSNSQLKAVLSSKALSAEQRIAILTSQGLSEAEATAKLTTMGLATSEGVAAGATTTLGGTLKGLWATIKANPLILIITGVTAAISAFNTYQDSIKEAQQATIDTAKEATDHIKELESSMKSYLELDTSATETDKASALKSVTEQINNKTEALKNATEAEKGYKDAVMDSIEADYNYAAGKAKDAAVAAKEKIAGQWDTDYTRKIQANKNNSDKEVYGEVKDILGDYLYTGEEGYRSQGEKYSTPYYYLGQGKIDTNDTESLLAYYDKLQQAQEAIQQKALELGEDGNALLESPLYKAISEILNNETNKTNIDDYITNRSEEIYNSAIASQGIPETVEQFNALKETMLQQAGDSTLLADSITNRLNSAYGSLANEATKAENKVSSLDFTIDTETFTKQLETQKDEIANIADGYKKISGVIDDYNNNGNMSIENLETLISVGDEYISTLFDENGKLNLNKDSYAKLAKAKLEDIRYSMLENAISSLNQLSKEDETSANNELAESTGNLTEETLKLVAAKKLAEGVSGDKIQNIIHTYSEWSALIDNTEAGLENNIDATLGLESASDKLKDSLEGEKKALENSKSALEDKKKALEDTKNGYENAIDSIKSLINWTENYIKQTKEDEIDALEKKKQSVDDLIESQKELLQAQKDEYDWNKEISDKQNSVAKNALAASIASLDDSSSGKKAYKEAIDTLNESRSDMTDTLYEHSIDTRMDALDKLKEQSDEYYDSEIDKINEFLNNEVALYKAACSMIDNDNGSLYSNLLNYCKTYTTTSETEFNHMWTSAQSAMQQYNIANLDTFSLLNDLQGRIYEVDTAIDTVASGIESYEDKISGVQSKLDNLSNSAQTAINNINSALNAENELNKAKWYYDWQGTRYESNLNQKASAIQDILRKIENDNGGRFPASAASIYGKIKHYAKGTRNSVGGLSITQEDGFEAIFQKLQNGEYTMMPKGSQVFNSDMTDNLYNFSADPQKFISEIASKFNYSNYLDSRQGDIDRTTKQIASNYNQKNIGDITVNSPINIQGDATQSTIKALKAESDKIVDKATKNVMNIALRNKRLI